MGKNLKLLVSKKAITTTAGIGFLCLLWFFPFQGKAQDMQKQYKKWQLNLSAGGSFFHLYEKSLTPFGEFYINDIDAYSRKISEEGGLSNPTFYSPLQLGNDFFIRFNIEGVYHLTKWLGVKSGFAFYQSISGEGRNGNFMVVRRTGPPGFSPGEFVISFMRNQKLSSFSLGGQLDILPGKERYSLLLGFDALLNYGRFENGVKIENTKNPPREYFEEGVTIERFERYDWFPSLQIQLDWEEYFTDHWGYNISGGLGFATLYPNKMKRLEYSHNGNDRMPALSTRQKEFIFSNSRQDNPEESGEPKILEEEKIRWREYNIQVGIIYRF